MLEEGEIDEEEFEQEDLQNHISPKSTDLLKLNEPIVNLNNKRKNEHSQNSKKRKKMHQSKSKLKQLEEPEEGEEQSDDDEDSNLSIDSEDKDERMHSFAPKPLLPSPPTSFASWSTPPSKKELNKPTPVSLFDLFPTSSIKTDSKFIDPVVTEKENNKPVKFQNSKPKLMSLNTTGSNAPPSLLSTDITSAGFYLAKQIENKRKNQPEPDESELTVSVESIQKKMEKKRKYLESVKEKEKKQAERELIQQQQQQQLSAKREQILCHFFMEGRCQKGDKCPFSHQQQLIQANKKYEICKYYLNGFCAKNEKCLFLHSEFPCKFYHRINFQTGQKKNECLKGDKCPFSHEPITDPLLKEAFDKYISESSNNNNNNNNNNNQNSANSIVNHQPDPSIPSLMNIPLKPAELIKPNNPSSPPQPLLSTPHPSLLESNRKNTFGTFKDVDERSSVKKEPLIPKNQLLESSDVDLRAPVFSNPIESTPAPLSSTNDDEEYEKIKKELILKIMKALADDDGGIFSKIPKQTLTDLMVKLLSDSSNKLSTETIVTLLATLTAASSIPVKTPQSPNPDNERLNESSSNLQIDLDIKRESSEDLSKKDYVDEEDDYDYDNELVIEGSCGEIPYQLVEIDIEPSSLWNDPPIAPEIDDSTADQECDPRIKYYSNKANCTIVSNFQLQLIQQQQQQLHQQQQQMTPTSPSSSTKQELNTSPVSSGNNQTDSVPKAKPNRIADPRLARTLNNNNNQSPTRSISPPLSNDLLSIQSRQLSSSSLLSSLPDFQVPKSEPQRFQLNTSPSYNSQNDSNTVKLSIEDYKRKLKPANNSSNSSNSNSISSSLLGNQFSMTSNNTSEDLSETNPNTSSSLPSIPSYTLNLQAPQSLHELLRNFQS